MTRIFITHIGSIPRTQKLGNDFFSCEKGRPHDLGAFDAAMINSRHETIHLGVEGDIVGANRVFMETDFGFGVVDPSIAYIKLKSLSDGSALVRNK